MTATQPSTPAAQGTVARGPYRAEYGAIIHEDMGGFLFTVSPPSFADDVAKALNAKEAPSPEALPASGAGGEAELFYMIEMSRERAGTGPAFWWSPTGWWSDWAKAARFGSHEDAERIRVDCVGGDSFVSEHAMMRAAPDPDVIDPAEAGGGNYMIAHARAAERDQEVFRLEDDLGQALELINAMSENARVLRGIIASLRAQKPSPSLPKPVAFGGPPNDQA